MTKEKKVGIFVIMGLIISTVAVFMIGENRKFWERKVTYQTSFKDVAGLRPGAPVRLGGFDVGTVSEVSYGAPSDPRVYVKLAIVQAQANRIRKDKPKLDLEGKPVIGTDGKPVIEFPGTVARVANKGLLGDKMVELSVADGRCPQLDPAEPLQSDEGSDLMGRVNEMSVKVDNVVSRFNDTFGDPKFHEDLKGTVSSLHDILDGVAHKDGAAHRFIFDPKEADRIDHILANLDQSSAQLNGLLTDAHDVTTHARTGPGLVHALIYDGDLSANAAGSLAEVHKDLEQIRTGKGMLHGLLYGDADTATLVTNVNAMSDDLRVIVHNLKEGKGTLGALLVDPSVYEDVKSLVGNVDRNQVLRALVRYTIKQDETPKPAAPPTVTDK